MNLIDRCSAATSLGALLFLAVAFALAPAPLALDVPNSSKDTGAVQVQMHNVMYHYSDTVAVHLRDVAGALVPSKEGQMPIFDSKESFSLHITAAEIAMDPQSLEIGRASCRERV